MDESPRANAPHAGREDYQQIQAFRRSIVAARPIAKGQTIQIEDLDVEQAGNGIGRQYLEMLMRHRQTRDMRFDAMTPRPILLIFFRTGTGRIWQQTPRAMLNTTVNEVGNYLKAARTLAVIGVPGRPPEMAAEYCTSGLKPAPGAQVVFVLAQNGKSRAGRTGRLVVDASEDSILNELGLQTALGVTITDKETRTPGGDGDCRPSRGAPLEAE